MINGRTGSGKSVFGAWLLSTAPLDRMPYIIVDYKRDKLLQGIDRAEDLDLADKLPKRPGLYRVTPLHSEPEAVEDWLWRVWAKGKTGLLIDEGYMIPDGRKNSALQTLFTQGRALGIPVIILSQRPAWLNRFCFSECDYYCCFHLNDVRDQLTVKGFTPHNNEVWDMTRRLPPHHSRWYDIGRDYSAVLGPAPDPEKILDRFDAILKPKQRWV